MKLIGSACGMVLVSVLAVAFSGLAGASAGFAAAHSPLQGVRQLLLVRAADWNSTTGTLQRYTRAQDAAAWQAVGAAIPVSLGRNGLGWGRGLHPAALLAEAGRLGEPVKQEGDGRAPTGLFALPGAFAADPADLEDASATGTAMPLLTPTADFVCVDDIASRHYNTIQPRTLEGKDWQSAEDMLRPDGLYRFGLFAAHNQSPVDPGAGSCIFLHIARGPGQPTAGCTAMETQAIQSLLAWLLPEARPVLAQFPEAAYARVRAAWGLP
ncbi:L,D-transpeptidase family protein [Megalodesulfovibrio paquesii]